MKKLPKIIVSAAIALGIAGGGVALATHTQANEESNHYRRNHVWY